MTFWLIGVIVESCSYYLLVLSARRVLRTISYRVQAYITALRVGSSGLEKRNSGPLGNNVFSGCDNADGWEFRRAQPLFFFLVSNLNRRIYIKDNTNPIRYALLPNKSLNRQAVLLSCSYLYLHLSFNPVYIAYDS